MIRSRTAQLLYQTVYCTLGLIALICSLGYLSADFNEEFYVYYTNLSNYFCTVLMFVALVQTARRKGDGYVTSTPTLTFFAMIAILVTLLVYNFLLTNDQTPVRYLTSLSNMLSHLILPVMFIAHWVLFCPHGKLPWHRPLLSLVPPVCYVVFILLRAACLGPTSNATLYPYFFLDVAALGWGGFFRWIAILFAVFVTLGYVFFAIDRLLAKKTR